MRYLQTYSETSNSNDIGKTDIDHLVTPFREAEAMWAQAANESLPRTPHDKNQLHRSAQRLYRLFIRYCPGEELCDEWEVNQFAFGFFNARLLLVPGFVAAFANSAHGTMSLT